MIYLRPNPPHFPISYHERVEQAGLVLAAKHSIAMYTVGSGRRGAQGIPGEDKNSWFDTIIAADAYHSEWDPVTLGGPFTTFRSPYPLDLTEGYVRVGLTAPPLGADMIIDLHMNGVSMFSTPIHIDPGMETSVGSATPAVLSTLYVPDDAKFEMYVLQIGTLDAGYGIKIAVTGVKTEAQ